MNEREKEVFKAQLQDEEKTLKYLKQVYKKSAEDVRKKIADLNSRTDLQNLQTIIYQRKYQEALLKQIDTALEDLNKNQYKTLNDFFEGSYVNGYVGSMYNLEGQGIPMTVPIDPKKMIRAIQIDSKLSKNYYQKRLFPENISRLKLSIKAEVSRGIATGETWLQVAEKIATGMNSPFTKALSDAMRIVRTEGHRVNQQGFVDAGDVAKEKGADIVKQWDATLDSRTRPWHQEADGQIREWDDDFIVHGEKMKAPSLGGSASNVINCRCQLLQRAKWALDEDELKTLEERAKFYGLDKTKDFEEYKNKYLQVPDEKDSLNDRIQKLQEDFDADQKKVDNLDEEIRNTQQLINAGEKKGYSRYDEYASKEELITKRDQLHKELDQYNDAFDDWLLKNPRPKRSDFFPDEDDISDELYEKYSQMWKEARNKWKEDKSAFETFIDEQIEKRRLLLMDVDTAISDWSDIEKYREASRIGIDELKKRKKELEEEQRELLKEILKKQDNLDELKRMLKEEETEKLVDSAKFAYKTSHGEYKKYQRDSKLGDGTSDGYKRISKTNVYVTPEGVEFEFPVGLDKKKQTLTPEQLTKAWERVPEGIRRKSPKTIQVLDYYNPKDSYWRKTYKNFPHSYATGGIKGVTFYRHDYDHDDDYLVNTLCHEIGHSIDQSIKTNSGKRFCDDSEWTKVMKDDFNHSGIKSPTTYGENANAEDLAESVAQCTLNSNWFKKNFPNRTKVLEQYILN